MSISTYQEPVVEMYLTGFALCLSACLDLGIVNVATIKRGLDSGALAAFVLQIGACFSDLTYALLSMFGFALVLADRRHSAATPLLASRSRARRN